MTSDQVNGNAQSETVNVALIPMPSGAKIVYTTTSGRYLGTVQFDAPDPQAMGLIGNLFQQFCAQQANRVQVAPAGAVAGLRTS
ncbi:MAG TPA: hypothetical protein VFB54_07250 [Burkholderiales bacterium]|nr:hypothetical protein [Burkholderiales bacterium]